MSHHQDISKVSGTSQTSPDAGVNRGKEPVPNAPQEHLPKPFSIISQFRGDLIVLLWRFFLTSFSLALLVMTLWGFSELPRLSTWEQHSFDTISILIAGMTSLGIGSLLGYLGSMLRWPLLSRTTYKMRDVDSILGMAPPTRSLRLIKRHIQEGTISRTTFIVAAYFVANIFGRLSVAIFGFAFDLKDERGIEYPILSTNWTSASWTRSIDTSSDEPGILKEYEIIEEFLNSAWNGLRKYTKTKGPDWAYGENSDWEFGDSSSFLRSDLSVSNATLEVGTDIVEYWYDLKDFKEDYARLLNHTVHSAANCSLIEVDQGQYWRWNKWNKTGPFNWSEGGRNKDSDEAVLRTLWLSNSSAKGTLRDLDGRPIEYPHWVSFKASSNQSYAPSQIYILCGNFAWECWPTLTETFATKSYQQIQPDEQLFHSRNLYGLLGVRGTEDSYSTDPNVTISLEAISRSPAQAAVDSLEIICLKNFTIPFNETVWNGYRLWVSGVVARLPILAIMEGNTALPKIARGPYPNQTAPTTYTDTTLEVKWLSVGLIAASIIIGQLLAVGIVLYYCKGIHIRDDSYLATAVLLKTAINTPGFDGSKSMTGRELAMSLDHALEARVGEARVSEARAREARAREARVSYGTLEGQDGGLSEVDLASGLDAKFPPFPPGQQ